MDTPLPSVTRKFSAVPVAALLFTLIASVALPASAASGKYIAHNTPAYVGSAKNLGTEDPAKVAEISVWLNPRNRAAMDALAEQLYDPASPTYRKFLKQSQIATRFAPTAAAVKSVQTFLESHNLKVVRTGPNNFFVRARGTVGDIQSAFHVQLNNYQVRGKVVRSNDRDPYVDGAAATFVRSIAGLDTGAYEHPSMQRPSGPPNQNANQKLAASSLKTAASATASDFFSSNCFDGTEKETFSTNRDGEYPIISFKGNHLNSQSLTSAGCGYTPGPIQTAFGLDKVYAKGFDGTGQTIGIIDWCGSLTIKEDTNAFSAQFGLPLLDDSNFAVTYIPTPSLCESTGQTEINIDVQWAHAIAPGAAINLIVPPSATFLDVDDAYFTAVTYGLANVISGSYGSPESFTPPSVVATENLISEVAAISGIGANFSTGDSGDYTFDGIPPTVSAPADSPWATGVGGTALALNADNSIAWQAGWGNNEILLSEAGFIFDPPLAFGFIGGAGGGASNCVDQDVDFNCLGGFAKPSYQKHLAGKTRLVPDVGWLADPFTGAAILISIPGQLPEQVWQVWGGTSLACPMFAGLWAIANQAAGVPLGNAAPYLYSLPTDAILDVVPVSSKSNVTATIWESATDKTNYTASQVLGDSAHGKFVSAIWDYPAEQDTALVLSFGTDCTTEGPSDFFGTLCSDPTSLHTKKGWDNVTGVGVPNAEAFTDAFTAPKKK
jgi:subtilase family serine protease